MTISPLFMKFGGPPKRGWGECVGGLGEGGGQRRRIHLSSLKYTMDLLGNIGLMRVL